MSTSRCGVYGRRRRTVENRRSEGLDAEPLEPDAASWNLRTGTPQALLAYDAVRGAAEPAAESLRFLESGDQAGARLRGWDVAGLRRETAG